MTRPFEHPVRFGAVHGLRHGEPAAAIVAVCEPCAWRAPLANGHGHEDFARLTYEHSGFRQCQAPTCQAWIIDAVTDEGGKRTVADAAENPKGNLALRFNREEPGAFRVRYLKAGDEPGEGEFRVMSHFATCTEPQRFRRAKAGAR